MAVKYRRRWYLVTLIKGYANTYLVSASSKRDVTGWFKVQGKHGLIQLATSEDLWQALRGVCLSIGKSNMEAPNSWLVRVGNKITMVMILD
jgi:hypothetical protein